MDPIGTLGTFVLDVDDLEAGATFWSRLTGITAGPSSLREGWVDLDLDRSGAAGPIRGLSLRQASSPKQVETNRAHVDLWVDDVDVAIEQIEEIGGRRKTTPSIYPRPHSYPGEPPVLDWVVAHDPFGNEFCVIRELQAAEIAALSGAAPAGPADDQHWRAVARDSSTSRRWRRTPRRPVCLRARPSASCGATPSTSKTSRSPCTSGCH